MAGIAEGNKETQNGTTLPKTTTATTATTLLSASYSSPTNQPFAATQTLSAPRSSSSSSSNVEEKSRYLRDLRSAAAAIQERVNQELTARMEEDKNKLGEGATDPAAAGGAGGTRGKPTTADDVKEEENYGEETVEADE